MITSVHPLIQRLNIRQGEAQLIRSQITDENDRIWMSEQIESLAYMIWNTTSNTDPPELRGSGPLDVSSCWYDTWQPWDEDKLGFNFARWFPSSLFETGLPGNSQFKLEIKGIQHVTGESFMVADVILFAAGSLWPVP